MVSILNSKFTFPLINGSQKDHVSMSDNSVNVIESDFQENLFGYELPLLTPTGRNSDITSTCLKKKDNDFF